MHRDVHSQNGAKISVSVLIIRTDVSSSTHIGYQSIFVLPSLLRSDTLFKSDFLDEIKVLKYDNT
jgi:hypothetical protein